MTDLISRPRRTGPPPGGPGRQGRDTAAIRERPLLIAAAVGGVAAAALTLVVCLSLALTGWFLADAGGHGETTDALRVGADAWLAGHGADLTVTGARLGLTPLAITMILVLGAFRVARWSARHAAAPDSDRLLGAAVGVFTCSYLVMTVVVGVLASRPAATPDLGAALGGAAVISAAAGGLGLAAGSGRLDRWVRTAPLWITQVAAGAVAGALALVLAAALLLGIALLLSFNEAATVVSELDLAPADAVAYAVVGALLAPNAVLLAAAYLLGPGFAVGVGTSVSPTGVSLGVVPAFPMLAALPSEGPTPGWLRIVLLVPVIAAAAGVCLSRRGAAPPAYDVAALTGAAAGFGAGLLAGLGIALAGGAMGTGRMAEIGAPFAEVLVFATGLMSLGGIVGAMVCTWWQRRNAGGAP